MSFNILHIAPDDKFIPLQRDLFEAAYPTQNKFRVLPGGAGRLVHCETNDHLSAVDAGYFSSAMVNEDLAACDCVVFHSIRPEFASMFEKIPERKLVVWSAWGQEYAPLLIERHGEVVLDASRRLHLSSRLTTSLKGLRFNELFRRLAKRVRGGSPTVAALRDIASRIDVASVNILDLPRLREVLTDFDPQHHLLQYYTTENTFAPGPVRMSGPDVLLGNSATPTNNHVEAFDVLRKLDLRGRRVITPLSYGNEDYSDRVCKLGAEMLGDAFVPLRDFLTVEEFNEQIKDCGTVVMNHIRQQAIGTICAALTKHARVYLRPDSVLFRYFCDQGVAIHSIVDLTEQATGKLFDEPAGSRNARIIGDYWSRERAIARIRDLETFAGRAALRRSA
ncbi:MAG: TDP-N-acetylfucosamine:lipid II N-acetylfucosaminyltransferase [Gammaproteobacteria bacterium]|nr:TDP-N-acetylfucosamine:lipid II N-acetylfucosaminyltransferase [Gammaproteobacteria bacterium]